MYKQSRQSRPSVVETNSTSLELSLPVDEDYIIQIKSVSEGGEGSSSKQITIPRIAGLLIALTVFITIILQYAELTFFFLGYHVNNAIFGNYIKYTKQVKENQNIYHTIWNCVLFCCLLAEILYNFCIFIFCSCTCDWICPREESTTSPHNTITLLYGQDFLMIDELNSTAERTVQRSTSGSTCLFSVCFTNEALQKESFPLTF